MKMTFTLAVLPLNRILSPCKSNTTFAHRKATVGNWRKLFGFCFVIMALAVASSQIALSQEKDEDDEPVVVQVYDVAEFVTHRSDQPFEGFVIPGVSDEDSKKSHGGGGWSAGGPGGGGGGFGGGGSGGGAFCIAPSSPRQFGGMIPGQAYGPGSGGSSHQLTTKGLANVIMDSVAESTWAETNGQNGRINFIGTTMIVSQTQAVHRQIEALLKMLGQTKASTRNQSSVTINAIWLTIDETQLATLAPMSDRSVDREALEKLTKEFGRRGQITCFDGQRVHIAAGNLRSSVDSVIPVVGQNDLPSESVRAIAKTNPLSMLPKDVMAQVSSPSVMSLDDGERKVGYQPVARWINYGTVLQVLPRVEPDQQIWLDVGSTVVQPGDASAKIKIGSMELDKHNMYCQQFKTSIRVHDSTPTLVGGSAFVAGPQGKMQTYLILEATKIPKPEN